MERERFLDHGTFALQCHDANTRTAFRSIRVRLLPDDTPTPAGPAPVADDTARQIIDTGRHNIPMLDLHVHLLGGLTLEQALARSLRDGIQYGVAINGGVGQRATNDLIALAFIYSLRSTPFFIGFQAEGREWSGMFSRDAMARFDYLFTDSMTWTDNRGKRMRLWIPDEVGTIADPQEFMDTLVDRTVGILNDEPIDIYVNPTFLPDVLAPQYESLWTEPRRRKVTAIGCPAPRSSKWPRLPARSSPSARIMAPPAPWAAANTASKWSKSAIWSGRISSSRSRPPKPSTANPAP
jgi:hypothetical protein